VRIKEVVIVDPRSLSEAVTVASFRRYEDAQRTVDELAGLRLPAGRVAIAARELELVERASGRTDTWSAAGQGALSGAAVGALLGLLLGLFDLAGSTAAGLIAVVWGALLGAVVGALVGLAGPTLTEDQQDDPAELTFRAGRFDLIADTSVAEDIARSVHAGQPAA
jgi:predicted lipid-binding transport protein (Tim44 family)